MSIFSKKKNLYAFCNGQLISLDQVNDPIFCQGLVGKGVAIIPKSNNFYAPCDGEISMIFPTKHALGIKCFDNKSLILHVGIDTVKLKGNGFISHVKEGQKVKKGDLLLEVDLDLIKKEGYDTTSMLVVSEPLDSDLIYKEVSEVAVNKDVIFTIK